MARVGLYFETKLILSPDYGNWPLPLIRLMAKAQFQLPDGSFSKTHAATFDTGAPLSVLPRSLWRDLEREIHVPEATFGGISRRKVCQIRCSIGTVRGRLIDEQGSQTCLYDFPAFLAQTDRVPLIIGFADLLEEFDIHFNYRTGEAWVEER